MKRIEYKATYDTIRRRHTMAIPNTNEPRYDWYFPGDARYPVTDSLPLCLRPPNLYRQVDISAAPRLRTTVVGPNAYIGIPPFAGKDSMRAAQSVRKGTL